MLKIINSFVHFHMGERNELTDSHLPFSVQIHTFMHSLIHKHTSIPMCTIWIALCNTHILAARNMCMNVQQGIFHRGFRYLSISECWLPDWHGWADWLNCSNFYALKLCFVKCPITLWLFLFHFFLQVPSLRRANIPKGIRIEFRFIFSFRVFFRSSIVQRNVQYKVVQGGKQHYSNGIIICV